MKFTPIQISFILKELEKALVSKSKEELSNIGEPIYHQSSKFVYYRHNERLIEDETGLTEVQEVFNSVKTELSINTTEPRLTGNEDGSIYVSWLEYYVREDTDKIIKNNVEWALKDFMWKKEHQAGGKDVKRWLKIAGCEALPKIRK